MKAAVFGRPGIENVGIVDVDAPSPGPHEVLIRVVRAGVNPVDRLTVTGARNPTPMPHIPGAEFAGIVEEVGAHVDGISRGDIVIDYPRVFCGRCDMCISGREMLCRTGGVLGTVSNGGFAELAVVPYVSVMKVDASLGWDLLASLPVSALTAYHGLRSSGLRAGQTVAVVGASGNTGMFAVQLAHIMGARVVAISRKPRGWLMDMGADAVVEPGSAMRAVAELTGGAMADVVVDPLGSGTASWSLGLLGSGGKLISYGVLTGQEVQVDMRTIYSREISIVGTTGGTRAELVELIAIASSRGLDARVWRKYGLGDVRRALEDLSSGERDGRVMLDVERR
ncbi:MAG: alcohol dehydrogenase catalytic domain-containing protein [Nitrososphaeria archaeon]|jgi:D-arabinose 1-dehydrogenase-like Zn-dependent alcohol dehydrogenase